MYIIYNTQSSSYKQKIELYSTITIFLIIDKKKKPKVGFKRRLTYILT